MSLLSEEQLKVLEETWAPVSADLQGAGNDLFFKLFEMAPHTQELFPFGDVPTKELRENESFNKHALGVMQTVETAVCLLKDNKVEDLNDALVELGIVHTMKNANISKDYFKPVGEALLSVISKKAGSKFTPEAKAIWLAVYGHVENKMAEGMEDADLM